MGSPPLNTRVAMDVRKLPLLELPTRFYISYITTNTKSKVSITDQLLNTGSHFWGVSFAFFNLIF